MSDRRALSHQTTRGAIRSFLYSQKAAPYVFALPFILAFLIFFLMPTIQTVYMSFQKVYGLSKMEYIGLKNYMRLNNVHFFNAIKTNTVFTLACVVTMIPIPLLLAVLLNNKFIRSRHVYRSIIFIPSLTAVIVAGIVFRLIFGSLPTGLMNWILGLLGIAPVSWSLAYWPSMVMMVTLALWRMTGIYMIYFLSGLQTIPDELYESAEIDGAGTMKKFRHIMLPLLKPTTVYVLTLIVFQGYRMFAESYVYWNENTPGDLGLTITRYIYNEAFRQNDMGFGSAIGITLLCIVLVINLLQLNTFGLFRKEG